MKLHITRLAHFEFSLSDARHRMSDTAYSTPREENPNCAQTRNIWKRVILILVLCFSFGCVISTAWVGRAAAFDLFGQLCSTSGGQGAACDKTTVNGQDPLTHSNGLLIKVARVIGIIAGVAAIIVIIIAAIKYTSASGDPAKAASAKNTIIFALVGLIITVMAEAIVGYILGRL